MHNNQSSEDYLETILVLSKQKPVVRSIDIVEELGYKKSSISVAMKNLRERNHIEMSKEGFITLTPSGRQIAEMIYDRHQCLTNGLPLLVLILRLLPKMPARWNMSSVRKALMPLRNILSK